MNGCACDYDSCGNLRHICHSCATARNAADAAHRQTKAVQKQNELLQALVDRKRTPSPFAWYRRG